MNSFIDITKYHMALKESNLIKANGKVTKVPCKKNRLMIKHAKSIKIKREK